jgi:hypothetical protein
MHRYESRDQALGNQHNKTEASEEADGAPKVENSLGCLPTVQSSRHLKHSYLFTVKLSLHKKLLALYHKESEPEPSDCDEICVCNVSFIPQVDIPVGVEGQSSGILHKPFILTIYCQA